MTLNEIRGIIEVRDGRSSPCAHVLATIQLRAAEIPRKIEDLQEMKYALDALDATASDSTPKNAARRALSRHQGGLIDATLYGADEFVLVADAQALAAWL